jgi:hypothetical protein
MKEPLESPTTPAKELLWLSLTEVEVYRSLKAARALTSPGEDGHPTLH